jgi:hypothetical protein
MQPGNSLQTSDGEIQYCGGYSVALPLPSCRMEPGSRFSLLKGRLGTKGGKYEHGILGSVCILGFLNDLCVYLKRSSIRNSDGTERLQNLLLHIIFPSCCLRFSLQFCLVTYKVYRLCHGSDRPFP